MSIFKILSYETRDCMVEYTVDADDEGEAINAVKKLSELSDEEASSYLSVGPILETNVEEVADKPDYQDIQDVNFWGSGRHAHR